MRVCLFGILIAIGPAVAADPSVLLYSRDMADATRFEVCERIVSIRAVDSPDTELLRPGEPTCHIDVEPGFYNVVAESHTRTYRTIAPCRMGKQGDVCVIWSKAMGAFYNQLDLKFSGQIQKGVVFVHSVLPPAWSRALFWRHESSVSLSMVPDVVTVSVLVDGEVVGACILDTAQTSKVSLSRDPKGAGLRCTTR